MRLFVALDIAAGIRERIAEFRNQIRQFAPDARWVGPETFHVTLQFLGETKRLDEIQLTLRKVTGSPVTIAFRNIGFFPNAKSPRVFWIGIDADERLQQLASSIAKALQPLGFEQNAGPFQPHLTLARAGGGRPRSGLDNRSAAGLQKVRAKVETFPSLEFGTMTAREFYLYESKLSPAGAQYTKLSSYPLE